LDHRCFIQRLNAGVPSLFLHSRLLDRRAHRPAAGFSLVELIMVLVIISIVAALAAPRVSRAGRDAQDAAVQATIQNVCQAIDHFYAEHNRYPGYDPDNGNPSGEWFISQLTGYSNLAGEVQASPGAGYTFGPYLRPPFPVNPYNGLATVKVKGSALEAATLNATGWIAVLSDGTFSINTDPDRLDVEVFSEQERALIQDLINGK